MDSSIRKKAGKYLSERKQNRRYKKMISVLTVAVMLGAIFVLAMPASTLEKQAYCGMEEHTHTDECYEKVLVCGFEEGAGEANVANQTDAPQPVANGEQTGHQHDESCYTETKTLVCGEEESAGHSHDEGCYTVTESKELTCGETESEEHTHTNDCYTVTENRELTCGQEEGAGAHQHTDSCYEISKELTCGQEETSGGENNSPQESAPGEGSAHVHTEACYELKEICGKEEHTHTQECYDETFSCGLREHAHTDACYGADGSLSCSLPEHTHIQRCRMQLFCGMEHEHTYDCYISPEVLEEDRKRIIHTDEIIDELPAHEEMEAKLAAFDEAGDLDGYEAYFLEISFQAGLAYSYYEDLNGLEELQQYVVNSEDLMALSVLWEAVSLDETENNSICAYSMNKMGSANRAALVYSEEGTVETATDGDEFLWWTAVVAEKEEEEFVVTQVIPSGKDTGEEKQAIVLSEDKIVLFARDEDTEAIQEGDYVQVDFDYSSIPAGTDPNGYGMVTFAAERAAAVAAKEKPVFDHGLTPVSSAETKDIVEINLYDYGTNINDKYKAETDKTQYPAFQQSGGAPNSTVSLTSVWGSAYNFGDNITTDYIDRKQTGFSVAGGNNINGMVKDANGSNANRALYGENSPMNKRLGEDGYPVLANGNSLGYLFSQSDYAMKKNTDGLDGLFQYNEETGEYYFDSRKNHAEFDGENRFLLYDALISPNYLFYPFGNFMPFNKINTESTPVSQINREYFENMAAYAAYKSDKGVLNEAYTELSGALAKFVSALDTKYKNQTWDGKQVLDLYFDSVKTQNAGRNKNDAWLAESMNKVYNIDYDVPKDFFFGMTLEMNYMQPKGGMTGKNSQYPMIFDFAGDDDVWVYIDGILMLDLSGIHRHAAATMDFANGTVTYYDFHSYAGAGLGATTTKDAGGYSRTYSFEEILSGAVGAEEAHRLLKFENGKYTTFKDYGTHNFKFYYMERGAGSGVCKINFNFPVIPKNSIAVGKEMNLGSNTTALGNPDFEFQVLKEGTTGENLPEDLFVVPGTVYDIYRNGVKTDQTGTVDQNGIIWLKAGEMAIIPEIDSSKGRYFVRELLDSRIFEQYGASITVDGTVGSGNGLSDTIIDGLPFKGADSPVKNIDDGSVTLFNFVNNVTADKTGSLSVTKKLTAGKDDWQKEQIFAFEVTLDQTPLPAGTKYTVGGEERTVTTAGMITLKADETAVISNILAGSKYTVKETAASAEGFDVIYSAQPEGNGEMVTEGDQTFIRGIILHRGAASAAVTVVNAKDDYGSLVIEKRIADQKEEYVKGETFSYKVYLENLASQKLEAYNGPYYLKDAEGFYYSPSGKTEINEISQAEPFGTVADGVIADVSPDFQIEITKIPTGSGFYVEEMTENLPADKYGEPQKDITEGTCDTTTTVTDASNTVTSDGAVKKDVTAQVVITNKLLSWQIVKRSSSSAELLLEGAEFELVKEGETEASYRGISREGGVVEWKNTKGETVSIYEIEAGAYIMEEIKSPVGYMLSSLRWKLTFATKGGVPEIAYANAVTPEKPEEEEPETEVKAEQTTDAAGNKQMTFYFENEASYRLPDAGGLGIYWYSIGGTLLMAAAVLILYKMRCKTLV